MPAAGRYRRAPAAAAADHYLSRLARCVHRVRELAKALAPHSWVERVHRSLAAGTAHHVADMLASILALLMRPGKPF